MQRVVSWVTHLREMTSSRALEVLRRLPAWLPSKWTPPCQVLLHSRLRQLHWSAALLGSSCSERRSKVKQLLEEMWISWQSHPGQCILCGRTCPDLGVYNRRPNTPCTSEHARVNPTCCILLASGAASGLTQPRARAAILHASCCCRGAQRQRGQP